MHVNKSYVLSDLYTTLLAKPFSPFHQDSQKLDDVDELLDSSVGFDIVDAASSFQDSMLDVDPSDDDMSDDDVDPPPRRLLGGARAVAPGARRSFWPLAAFCPAESCGARRGARFGCGPYAAV